MITLKYSQLLDKNFSDSISKLLTCNEFCPTTRYRLMRISTLVKAGVKQAVKERLELLTKYAQINEKGDFILNEATTDFQWKEGVDMVAVKSEVDGFGIKEYSIDKHPFMLDSLDCAKLSPIELSYLAPLIVFPDVD